MLNAILLFIPDDPLIQNVPVFFWQRYNNYLYQIRCLTLIVAPIAAIIIERISVPASRKLETDRRGGLTTVAWLVFILCLLANYSGWFILGSVTSIGTVSFNGHVYHLARYARYDDPSLYYLGKCDQNGYWCVFHQLYSTFLMEPGAPQITLGNDLELIVVKMGSETVYTYNGQEGHCMEDVLLVWCSKAPP